GQPLRASEQVAVLLATNEGHLDAVPTERVVGAERRIREQVRSSLPEICERIDAGDDLDEPDWEQLDTAAADAVSGLTEGD
ncbi:MAG: F0F1 ATP synthase subunit alpha, partial [Chromatiaceae bacterium]|nr:F0F1 ATP synthase subunit alpha [Chromatiaceae bacterium]